MQQTNERLFNLLHIQYRVPFLSKFSVQQFVCVYSSFCCCCCSVHRSFSSLLQTGMIVCNCVGRKNHLRLASMYMLKANKLTKDRLKLNQIFVIFLRFFSSMNQGVQRNESATVFFLIFAKSWLRFIFFF